MLLAYTVRRFEIILHNELSSLGFTASHTWSEADRTTEKYDTETDQEKKK